MPVWPVNQRMPSASKTAVFRFAPRAVGGEREGRDLVGVGVDADDRVQAAVGDPGVAVRPGDDAMGRGPVTERDGPDAPGRGVEVAERAVVLARVPDAAVRRRRDVVGMRAGDDVELPDTERDGGFTGWVADDGGAAVGALDGVAASVAAAVEALDGAAADDPPPQATSTSDRLNRPRRLTKRGSRDTNR